MATPEEIDKFADDLEAAARWFRERRDKFLGADVCPPSTINCFVNQFFSLGDFLGRGLGPMQKVVCGDYFCLSLSVPGGMTVDINQARSKVCERIEKTVIRPAEPEKIIPARPEREEIVVEWRCPESLMEVRS